MNPSARGQLPYDSGDAALDEGQLRMLQRLPSAASDLHWLDELLDEARRQFALEAARMQKHALAPAFVQAHLADHDDFLADVEGLRGDGGAAVEPALVREFVAHWLAHHGLGSHRQMVEQIRLIDAGASAADALMRSQLSAPPQQMQALSALVRILSSHKRALQAQFAQRTSELENERNRLAGALNKLERTQSQLLQSEKLASIGQLAAGVAHEINNPVGFVGSNLGTLRTYVERLLRLLDAYESVQAPDRDAAADSRLRQAIAEADLEYLRQDVLDLLQESQDGLARVKRIVADLKDFSHVDEAQWQHADLNHGLESTLNVVWNEIKYKAEVVRRLGELPPVPCIAAQINQVFMNLLVNAAQAIESRGTITLTSRVDGDHAVVEIADTGRGMPREIQDRIFEPFFTTKPVGKGTGLGLSIAWDIVSKHKGSLTVDSRPGEGSRFELRLPLAGPDPHATEAADG